MRYICCQVTCSIDVAADYQLSMYLTLAIFDISAQKSFLLILVENGLEILGASFSVGMHTSSEMKAVVTG